MIHAKSSPLAALAAEFHALAARLPRLLAAVDAAALALHQAEAAAHAAEDRLGQVIGAVEAARPATAAEARAKLAVARALAEEGIDPGRNAFLDRATAEARRIGVG